VEYQALLDALSPGLNPLDPVNQAQCWAEAVMLANTWAVDERLRGQFIPARMMEDLPTWIQACSLVAQPGDVDQTMRGEVAAQFLGFVGNSMPLVYDIIVAIAGTRFLGFSFPLWTLYYAPGINPGPPGFEWSGTRSQFAVILSRTGTITSDFLNLVRKVRVQLSKVLPGWDVAVVGTQDGCVPDVAVPDISLLAS
jgi:hypothetical protein